MSNEPKQRMCVLCHDYFDYELGESLCPECRDFTDIEYDPDKYFIYPTDGGTVECELCKNRTPKWHSALVCMKCWETYILNKYSQYKKSPIEEEEQNE